MKKTTLPAQHQKTRSGHEHKMRPKPRSVDTNYTGSGKLFGKVAIITGGDSGIGKAVAIAFAKEGARSAIIYYNEHKDATDTQQMIEKEGGEVLLIPGDISNEDFCEEVVEKTYEHFGQIDILVNNAAEQKPQDRVENITGKQWRETFKTNIHSYFYMVKAALPYFSKSGSTIINTTSVTAYRGSKHLLDYSSTKGAIVSFTRSLALMLVERRIRVNGVAPGPVWTPLIPSTFPSEEVATFGADVPMGRPGQPEEIAPSFVFLASDDSSYMTGQVLHPNGGEIING